MGRSGNRNKKIQSLKKTRGMLLGDGTGVKGKVKEKNPLVDLIDNLRWKSSLDSELKIFPGDEIEGEILKNISASGIDFSGVVWRGATLKKTSFSDGSGQGFSSALNKARFIDSNISSGSFSKSSAKGIFFKNTLVEECRFLNTDLEGMRIQDSSFKECVFSDANLKNAELAWGSFPGSTFSKCQFSPKTSFRGSDLEKAVIVSNDLAGANFSEIKGSGLNITETNLTEANFEGADLSAAYFSEVMSAGPGVFGGVSFKKINGQDISISDSSFPGADFSESDLSRAEFLDSNLCEADFEGADLKGARFIRCNLEAANINVNQMGDAEFVDCTWG